MKGLARSLGVPFCVVALLRRSILPTSLLFSVSAFAATPPYYVMVSNGSVAGYFQTLGEAETAMRSGTVEQQHLTLKNVTMSGSLQYRMYGVPSVDASFTPWLYQGNTGYTLGSEDAAVGEWKARMSPGMCSVGMSPGGEWVTNTGACSAVADQTQSRPYLATYIYGYTCQSSSQGYPTLCRNRNAICPPEAPYKSWLPEPGFPDLHCRGNATAQISFAPKAYVAPSPKPMPTPPNQCRAGNPCDALSGDKIESATDYLAASGLALTRVFSTATGRWVFGFESSIERKVPQQYAEVSSFAVKSTPYATAADACTYGWEEIKSQTLYRTGSSARVTGSGCTVYVGGVPKMQLVTNAYTPGALGISAAQLIVHRADGGALYFNNQNGTWTPVDGGVAMALTPTADGYTLRLNDGGIEHYNTTGQLIDYTVEGRTFTVTRNANQTTVADAFGRAMVATYSGSQITQVVLPDQSAIDYSYNGAQLTQVTFSNGETEGYNYITNGPLTLLSQHLYNGVLYAAWSYDAMGRATSSEHAGGAERVTFEYGDNYTRITEPLGAVRVLWTTPVKDAPRLTQIADNNGKLYEQRTYDANGFLASRIDALGHVTTYVHDSLGRETSRTEASGTAQARTITTTWDASHPFLRASITTPTLATFYRYDSAGHVLNKTETDAANGHQRVWNSSYNAQGQLLSIDGPRTDVADVTQFHYDSSGNLMEIIDALGHTTAITAHDGSGRPTTMVDANGLTTTLTYDVRGRLTRKAVGSEVTQLAYTLAGDLQAVTLPSGERYTYTHDDARRLTAMADSAGNRIDYTLDAGDNRVDEKVTAANGTVTRHLQRVFDSLSHLAQTLSSSGATTRYGYDDNQNLTETTDAQGHITTRTYDALHRLSQVTDALGGRVVLGYTASNDIESVADANGNTTRYTLNGFGERTRQASPDTGVTTFTYDSAGNLTTRTDAKGQVTTYAYDALNRVTSATTADGSVSYTYDTAPNGVGKLASLTDASGSTSYEYSANGRITVKRQVTHGVTLTTSYSYDSAGNLTAITYPSGLVVGYSYTLGKITSVSVNGSAALSNIAYAPFGSATSWTFGNGQSYQRTFDQDGQLTQHTLGNEQRALGYDLVGNITSIQDSVTHTQLGYDALSRLTSANDSTVALSWSYDANGNRLQQVSGNSTTTYSYATGSNRLSAIDNSVVYALVNHDANGSRTGDGQHSYQYDARDRLVAVDNGTTATYSYNGFGQRAQKQTATETRLFVYNEAGQLLGEYGGSGNVLQETVWLHTLPVSVVQNQAVYAIHPDHLGTPRVIADPQGRIVWRWDSEPFGTGAANEDPDGDGTHFTYNLRFPGHYSDAETGLHQNFHRDYDSASGGYTESDPTGLSGGLNAYQYANSNPLRFIDSSGLSSSDPGSKDDKEHCEQLNSIDTQTCTAIAKRRGPAAGAACHASASARYAACLRGQSLPPLNTWNNQDEQPSSEAPSSPPHQIPSPSPLWLLPLLPFVQIILG